MTSRKRKPAPLLDNLLSTLQRGPVPVNDLTRICLSRKAGIQAIYRLRNLGHEIIFKPSGSTKVAGQYELTKLAGDLRDRGESIG